MSNYRDDTQETAIAGDDTWLGLHSVVEETAKITGAALFGLMVVHSDQAQATDTVIDQANHTVVESALVSDEVFDQKHSAPLVTEQARVTESFRYRIGSLTVEQARVTDTLMDNLSAVTVESATVASQVIDHKYAVSLVTEQAVATDHHWQAAAELVSESAAASDIVTGNLSASALIAEVAEVADSVLDTHTGQQKPTVETAQASDRVIDALRAVNLVTETAVVEDTMPSSEVDSGAAWTANIETWGMSRYQPYTFQQIAVVDGVAYGVASDGLYALRGGSEDIAGRLDTGKLDLGQGQLVHPTEAYAEYELSGKMEMDVVTTQRGLEQSYTYRLPAELASDLTNGRIRFGKGLRGRHFRFSLRMTGKHGHINDLSVRAAPSKRRV